MQTSHRVVMNTGILYARMAVTVFLSLYATRVTLVALGAEDFGVFNVVGGAIAMLTFLNMSLAAATQRFMSFAHGQGDDDRQRKIFNVSILLHAGIAVALIAILEGAGIVLFESVLKIAPARIHAAQMVYQLTIVSTLFTVIAVPYDAVINARENMLLFSVLGVIEAVLKLGIAFAIVNTASDKLVVYGLLTAILTAALFALRAVYCHMHYHECALAPRRHFDKPLFREMTSFAGWSFLGSSTSMLANYGQGIVLNVFFGTVVNAAQGISNQVSGQLGAFAGTMLRALNPLIAKSEGAGNRELMLKASMTGSKVSFFLLMIFYIPMLLEMPYVFKLWLKDVPMYAVIFCQLQLIRNLVEQLFLTLVSSISAVGNIKNYQIVSSVLTCLPLVVTYYLFQAKFPPYSIYFVFIGFALITSGAILYFAKASCGLSVSIYIQDVVLRCCAPFIITLAASAIPFVLLDSGFVRLLLVGSVSCACCFASVFSFGFNKNERLWTGRLIGALRKRASIGFK
jgi:O-antigen/teichoic acid export membrane protein